MSSLPTSGVWNDTKILSLFYPPLLKDQHYGHPSVNALFDAGTKFNSARQFHYPLKRPDFYGVFVEAIFARLHPADKSIRFPDPDYRPQRRKDYPCSWNGIMKKINADHIEYIPGAEPDIPQAYAGLMLRIHASAISRDTKSVNRRIRDIFDEHEAMLDILSG